MKQVGLKIGAGITLLTLAGSAWGHSQRRKRNRRASELLEEIKRVVRPGSEGLLAEDAFDVHYLDRVLQEAGGKVIVMKESAAARIADLIEDAWGFWNDDEAQINSAFRSLRDKVQVSQVAKAYQQRFSINLIDQLRERLDNSELAEILTIVADLAPYRILNP